ncbi:MAG: XRE family transcriptional regulator [Erysipelotrichia bacterium]|nr:XRE family transcriptional regulator [Erysipelotrichia bacterium]
MLNDRLVEKIGIRIVYLRKLKDLEQETLAKKIGISRSYLSRIENGKGVSGVPISTYILIADALGITFNKLVDFNDL